MGSQTQMIQNKAVFTVLAISVSTTLFQEERQEKE
jgi:cell division protein ZapA (FtsZ GTPase activity inhibitor)